jgi:hypothetical protein
MELVATLPGEPLYAAMGYEVTQRMDLPMRDGRTLAAAHMKKQSAGRDVMDNLRQDNLSIALASPCIAATLDEGLDKIRRFLSEASAQGAEIVCFPEAYLPGLRGQDFEVGPFDLTQQERALQAVAQWARTYAVAAILGMERLTEAGRQIAAFVIDARGQVQGCQTKNQLYPTEEQFYVPGNTRRLFDIKRPAGADHQGRGSNRFDSHSIRTRALSGIHVEVKKTTGSELPISQKCFESIRPHTHTRKRQHE